MVIRSNFDAAASKHCPYCVYLSIMSGFPKILIAARSLGMARWEDNAAKPDEGVDFGRGTIFSGWRSTWSPLYKLTYQIVPSSFYFCASVVDLFRVRTCCRYGRT